MCKHESSVFRGGNHHITENRKSLPRVIISDNSTQFQATSTSLSTLFESETIRKSLSSIGTEWSFNPKRAPCFGGFWERLIELTKTSMKKLIGRSYVTLETLQTVVTEIEAIINDRPLTYVSSCIDDAEQLTSSHLLYWRRMTSLPHNNAVVSGGLTSNKADIHHRASWLALSTTTGSVKSRNTLPLYGNSTGSRDTHTQTITVGDVVQVHEKTPRSTFMEAYLCPALYVCISKFVKCRNYFVWRSIYVFNYTFPV